MPFLPNLDMEFDPDGSTEQVAVVMKGKTYRDAGLNKSKFPNIEGPLYDKLCDFPRHKYRDEVRKLALNIAIMVKETNFKPTIEWLDNFMRRFCISRKKSGLSYKKNFLKIKGSKNKSQSTGQLVREAEPLPDDSNALETEQNILSDTSNEILAINVRDPLDLGEEYTAFKASNGLSENSSLLEDIANDKISNATDETILFSSSNFREAERKDAKEIGDEQNSNYNGNGECPSDSDESIKEIPRERSPEKEVINLIESDDEGKMSVKVEAMEQTNDNVLPSEHPNPTEESKSDSNDLNKNNDEKLEQKDNEKQEKKTSKESEKGEKGEVDTVVEEDEEEEEEGEEIEDIDDGDTTTTGSDDSESGSSSEKGDKDDDLVVKQRKSWEDMNYVDYSKKEEKFYSSNMSNLQKKLDEKITQCTACFEQVNHTVKTEIFTHPVLGVLVCKKCFRFYGKGDFNKDPDGYDEYCRWCANGGDLLLCDHCTNGFCKKCIKRNLGRGAETEAINSKSWKCYVCDVSPLTEVRAFHRAVLDQLRSVSILNKTLSRKERKEWSIKQKFTALKMKRKTQGFATGGDDSKENLPSEFEKAMKGIQELCYLCLEQVNVVAKKSLKDQSDDAETKGQRRLLRLAHHMEKSFDKIKTSLGKTSGLNVEEILLNNSQYTSEHNSTSNKEQKEKKRNHSSHRNPGTSVDTSKETPHKQTEKRRRVSSNHDDGNESPPSKRIVLETDEEMEIEQQEPVNTTTNDNDDDDSETRKSKKDSNLLQADSSNEENAVSDAPIDDAASSKNPDGDTEREEIEDETLQTKLSSDKLKPLSQKSLSDSETEMSQSLLKDVQPSQNVSKLESSTSESKETKDKGASSDDSNSSKKGIIYRKSKTLKNRVNLKSDKELSDEIDNSDENATKNESKKTSNEGKVKIKLKEDSNSSDDEGKEKKVDKKKAKEDCDSKETLKKTSKSQNNLKSLLETDSDETDNSHSDEEKKFKKPSTKLHIKRKKLKRKKKSNYKPKPKSVQEAIKNKQLKSSGIKVERLPKSIQSKLEEEDYICISDFPEYFAKDDDLGLDSESDVELEAILKSKTKVRRKRKRSSSNDSENDADSEDNSQNEDENDPKEKEDKKPADKKCKKEKKVGLMDISLDNEEGDNNDDDDTEDEDDDDKKKKKLVSMNMKSLLLSSEDEKDEEIEEDGILDSSGETMTQEELEKKKRELYEKNKKKLKEKENNSESDNDEIVKKVKKKGFLSFKFSSSEDEDDESENEKEAPRKARMFIESDSDFELTSKKKKDFSNELFTSSSEDDDDESESSSDDSSKKSKKSKSRKRIKRPSSSTEEDEANENDLETPKKRHRRIIRDEDLLQSTKDATQEEKERRDRVKERQSRYNKIFEIDVEKDQSGKKKLILDFNEETKEELVKVNEKLVSFLKPHQHDGIKFMWDTTIESLEMIQKGERGGGCILAHCMGLGKTLQVIAFIHTLLTNKHINQKISRVMVCCPVNTVYNWKAEFKQWLRGKLDTFEVVELVSAKDLWGRAYRLEDWYNEGGVCIVGYEMFRNLSNDKNKRCKGALRDKFQKYLVNPGADIMVCDEGHILKNEKTSLSIAINKIATRRRIILTGTPLQNNLKEYHCMIQFVKPNLLGSRKEFMNRFVNPIEAGQCGDALKKDVSRMKKRAHILHNLLEGCVQRFDYTVLKPFLPPKYEYVISVQMSKEQIKLYSYYLENLAQGGPKRQGSGLFVDVNNLSRIWSHPVVLFYALNRFRDQDLEEDDGSNLEGFINDSDTSDSSEEERRRKKKKKKIEKDQDVEEEEVKDKTEEEKNVEGAGEDVVVPEATEGLTIDGKVRRDWYKKVVEEMCSEDLDEDSFFNRFEISGKLYLLFEILREAGSIGDKVLVFSQSIMVLDMIQEFLRMVDQREIHFPPEGKEDTASDIPQPFKHWFLEKDFYRLDGSTPAELRKDMCKSFNNPTNERCRLFLISTKAGGVGINLVAANRVVIFDTSWNPSHDTQSIFRIYRFGQKKPCYIYRFVAQGTMEEKIYSRQVTKISTSRRVVDEHQIKRHFNMAELTELYQFTPSDPEKRETPAVPENPNATQAQLYESVYLATEQIQRIHISQFQNFQAVMYNMATNPMIVPELIRTSIFKDRNELISHYDSQLRVLESNIQAESSVLKQIGAITNKTVSHNAKLAAGLVRGNPPPGGVSSTAQFVSRNVPVTSLVNTSFKSVSRPSTSNVNTTSASTSNNPSPAPGTAETASKPSDQVMIL
ncbi:Transcriptional regulator ATRX-like protein [Armadillidium nasatum]|uniref:ATP-dependent helicase ATRX n=1 Tax=Armadillidium nasatum TaxID=96803 RepID=A0A5N5TN06_9CRUS|nr:Transcriptional regulator ATRX-like protein [Armadillidium nasatum]